MVEDKEIKTTVSPFAMREGEIKAFDGKDGYVSINQIIHKINMGTITKVHFDILNIVNEFEFITSRQIFLILQAKGVEIKSQLKLTNKLDQLVKSKILTRYYFRSEDGKGAYRVYCLEKMGKYLLKSREIPCTWQPTDNTKPASLIKKRLAGNQVIIAYLRKATNYKRFVVKPQIKAKSLAKTFKAHGLITIEKEGKAIDLVFEAVRREEDWVEHLITRMNYYKDFYQNFVPGDSEFAIKPQLIIVCEDDKHMVETFKEIVTNNLEIPGMKLYFTTDLKQNLPTLDETLVEFDKDEEGKYKAIGAKFKILG